MLCGKARSASILPEPIAGKHSERNQSSRRVADEKNQPQRQLFAVFAVKYLETRQELNQANRQVKDLAWDNYHLKESNCNYQKHNQKLYKENSSYRLLRKLLGKKQIDQLIDQAKQRKSKEREL